MYADLLRSHPTLRRHVRPVTFLFNDLGKRMRLEVVPSRLGSWRAEMSLARSDPEDPRDPAASVPPRLWGRPSRGWHLRRRGVRMLRDRADQPDRFRNTRTW